MLAWLAFPVLAVLTVYLLSRWTVIAKLPWYVTAALFVSFFIPISTVALVPFDLANDAILDNSMRLAIWRAIYWLSFVLMWAVLPILQGYVESGYFAPLAKLQDAFRSRLKSQLAILFCGLIGAIYVTVTAGLSFTSLKALCVALSHSYGLVLVIWMLGHGAISIPRAMFLNTAGRQLHDSYCRAPHVYDAYRDAQANYDDVVGKILALEAVKNEKYAPWIDSLVGSIRAQDLEAGARSTGPLSTRTGPGASASASASARRAPAAQPRDLTPANVSDLGWRLYRDESRLLRSRADWEALLTRVEYFERLSAGGSRFAQVRPLLFVAGGALLSALSVVVVWSEIVSGTRLSLVDLIVSHVPKALQVFFAAVILGYMCFLVNASLTSMRVFNLYAIVPKHTDPSSLIFYAAYALRLTVPLSYNFLMLTSTEETVFQEFLGKYINLTALGKYFNQVLPRLIVVPVVLSAFNVYELVKDYLGFGLGLDYFGDDENDVVSAEPEGRDLVRRAMQGFSTQPQIQLESAEPTEDEQGGLLATVKTWFS